MTPAKSGSAGFFTIDRRTWGALCDRQEMNPAVAYLVLAQGTGHGNAATSWSVTSLKTWTGIDWDRGKIAIQKLVTEGFIRYGEKHNPTRPRYELVPWIDLSPQLLETKRANLSAYERDLLTQIMGGWQPTRGAKAQRETLDKLVLGGFLIKHGNSYFEAAALSGEESVSDPIWLPNSLVVGTKRGEESPIRRIRSSGDIWTLRLLVDLYHVHNLRADGGISPHILRQQWERRNVGRQGIFEIWAFKPGTLSLYWSGPFESHQSRPKPPGKEHPVWESVQLLQKQGLLSFVPYLWEGDQPDAEPMHPYGIQGYGGELVEIEIGTASCAAARQMGLKAKTDEAIFDGFRHLAPVKNTLPNVQMFGIARLTYRPHTKRTKDWWQELQESAEAWRDIYQTMAAKQNELPKAANFR